MSRSTKTRDSSTLSFSQLFSASHFLEELEGALDETDSWEQRQRALPATLVTVLVVAMSLFRHLSIPAIYRDLRRWYRRKRSASRTANVTDQALSHAKRRLGVPVFQRLFERLVTHIRIPPTFHGLRVFAVDGVKMSVPDTASNEEAFGRCKSSNGDKAAFPQLLAVCLISAWSRQVMALSIDRHDAGERRALDSFLEHLGPDDLLLLDRGFYATWLFERFLNSGTHFLCRSSTTYNVRVVERLGPGDYLVDISGRVAIPPDQRRTKHQRYARTSVTLRMIEYRIERRGERVRLLTDLRDPRQHPALELAKLYHQRWECELAFDEIKTHLATVSHGTLHLPFRSQSPDGVRQEAFGLFVAYNLVRSAIVAAAETHRISPTRISFVASLNLIRTASIVLEVLPEDEQARAIRRLISEIARQRLPRDRRHRRYPRAVRIKINRFPRKRSWHSQTIIDLESRIRLLDRYSRLRKAA